MLCQNHSAYQNGRREDGSGLGKWETAESSETDRGQSVWSWGMESLDPWGSKQMDWRGEAIVWEAGANLSQRRKILEDLYWARDEGKKFWKSWKGMSPLAVGLSITIMVNKNTCLF